MSEQGKQYASFIEAELRAENEQLAAVNTRAASALTGSAGLVTLVLGVFAVLIGKDFQLDGSARQWLLAALVTLLVAAFCAVVAGLPLPWGFRFTATTTLLNMLDSHWGDDDVDARYATARCNVEVLDSLRQGTTVKVKWLIASGICQLVAVVALVGCTIAVVQMG